MVCGSVGLEGIVMVWDYVGAPETPIPLGMARCEQYRAPRAPTHRERWHAQHSPMRSHFFAVISPEIDDQPKKDLVVDCATAQPLPACTLLRPSHRQMPQPVKAERARTTSQLRLRERSSPVQT